MSFGYGGSGRAGQQHYGGHGQQISSGHVGSPPTNFGRGKVQLTYATTARAMQAYFLPWFTQAVAEWMTERRSTHSRAIERKAAACRIINR